MAFHLAQLNIAKMKFTIDDPQMKDFVDALDPVNAHAERSPGYVWRMQDESGNNTSIRDFGAEYLVNLTVWEDIDSLLDFMSTQPHAPVMRRKREWFDKMATPHLVLWWVAAGHLPTTEEAKAKLEHLTANGPSEDAFTLSSPFPAPDDMPKLKTGS